MDYAWDFIKEHRNDVILFVGVVLISLLSFAAGFIFAHQQENVPLQLESFLQAGGNGVSVKINQIKI